VSGLIVVATSVVACSGPAPVGGQPPASAVGSASAVGLPKPESEIVVAGGGGVIADATKAILAPWAAKNGVKVTYIEANSAQSLAKVQAAAQAGIKEIDVVVNNEQTIAKGRANNLWEPLLADAIPNLKNLDPKLAFPEEFLGKPPVGVRSFLIPSGIAYNTDVFKKNGWAAPTSWLDLYDPKYGKCTLPLSPRSGLGYLQMLNYLNTGDYGNITVTLQKFKAIAKTVPSFTDSNPPALELLQQGTGCIIPSQLHRTLEQQGKGAPIAWVYAKEGTPFVGGSFAIVRNAPHPIAAKQAVNEMLSDTAATKWGDVAFQVTTNLLATHSTTGPSSKLPVASEFKSIPIIDLPTNSFDNVDSWIKLWDQMAAGQ
jgi:putative spermidine/putrescine transport system substrate-binding protein